MSSAEYDKTAGAEAPARRDLISGSRLLEQLASLISVDPCSTGRADVVVAAPHHAPTGTPVSGGHDVETGPIAYALAQALSGKSVVAHELRTFVDLNKTPHEQQAILKHLGRVSFRQADRQLKLYYQSQLYASNPSLVIEIHGHVRGNYDIEVSAGFMLDERVPQDSALAAALMEFKAALARALSKAPLFADNPPTIGVFPLDRDVKFSATGTYTFNKVEKLRELGVNVAGLHIELGRELRVPSDPDQHRASREQLVACLTEACQIFLAHNQQPVTFDMKELVSDFLPDAMDITPMGPRVFVVQPAPKEQVGRRVATFSPGDMERFGIGEGQSILVSRETGFANAIELRAAPADKTRPGAIGIGKDLRSRLDTQPGEEVHVGMRALSPETASTVGFVACISESCPQGVVHVGTAIAEMLKTHDPTRVLVRSPSGNESALSPVVSIALPHKRAVGMSVADATRLATTYGDLACFFAT